MFRSVRRALVALALGVLPGAAFAADAPPVIEPAPAPVSFQPWQVRLRAVVVLPQGGGSLATVPGGAFISNGFRASNQVIPKLDISYYFTPNIAVEAICCLSKHNVYLSGGPLDNQRVASTWLFPPTVLLQYHWTNFGAFQPYIGVGVNYTHYFSQQPDYVILNTVTIKDSWGVAGQIGFDYMLDEHWGVNFDVKKILMEPTVNATVAPGLVSISGRAAISPWMIGGGVTYRFGGPSAPVVAKY